MKAILTLILFLTFLVKGFSCECPEYNLPVLDKESYEWSNVILIGNIVKTGNEYQINVDEVLKGEVENKIITGLTEGDDELFICTFYPHRKGKYLLYLKKILINGNTFFYSSECLGTRSLDLDYMPVSLRSKLTKNEILVETNKWIAELRNKN